MPDAARPVVLVVEDEPLQRVNIASVAEDVGCEALEAWSAAVALDVMAERLDVRLVITDIDMPGDMDGLGLAEHIRERDPALEIVIVTAGLKPDVTLLPVRSMFMPKPLNIGQLETAIRQLAFAARP